jgi:signal transduction histidine kinase
MAFPWSIINLMRKPPALSPEILVPRLGESLIEQGMITRRQLDIALVKQKNARKNNQTILLGQILTEQGFVQKSQLDQVVTEQILKLRNALQKTNEELEERVRQRTAELEIANKKLTELSQLKSNFIASISHELRTPMTHIIGYLELFLNRELGELSPQQYSALEVLSSSSHHLEKLINDLILFTMMERRNVTLDLRPVQLHKLIDILLIDVKPIAKKKGISLDYSLDPEDFVIEADQSKLGWVINELMVNAIKFTPSKGMVNLITAITNEHITISVSDTGIGIPPGRIQEAFEPFHQLDGSSTRKYRGVGIGLTLAQEIIKAHGSEIVVASEEGKGTQVSFTLKLQRKSYK